MQCLEHQVHLIFSFLRWIAHQACGANPPPSVTLAGYILTCTACSVSHYRFCIYTGTAELSSYSQGTKQLAQLVQTDCRNPHRPEGPPLCDGRAPPPLKTRTVLQDLEPQLAMMWLECELMIRRSPVTQRFSFTSSGGMSLTLFSPHLVPSTAPSSFE